MSTAREDYLAYGPGVRLFAVLVGLFMLTPVVFIVYYSFSNDSYFSLSPSGFSLKWFQQFFSSDSFRTAFGTSLLMGAIVTPVSLIIAVPTAWALVRGRFRGVEAINALLMSPIIIPGVVTGIAFLILLYHTGIGPGFTGLVIAMICFTLPYSVRALVANLHGMRTDLEEAARNLGASNWQAFRLVVLPQLRPGLIAGGTFVFVEAIDNFSVSTFLAAQHSTTLPVAAYAYMRDFDDPTVAAMSAVLILLSTLLVLVVGRLIGLEKIFRVE
jgi:ABC-type spermidine/putrescine transport system permease subunit II